MSDKRPRARLAGRVLGGLLIGGLATTLVVVVIDRRSGGHTESASVTIPPTPTSATTRAALHGTYDVTLTVSAAEYGATWTAANPQLTSGQSISQRWSIDCRATTCVVSVATGHVAEDPDRATLATSNGTQFVVSGTKPASPDNPALPAGCGTVDAVDLQNLTLTAASGGASFSGRYSVHHPVIHIEGPVTGGTASCDSFNVVFDITGLRR